MSSVAPPPVMLGMSLQGAMFIDTNIYSEVGRREADDGELYDWYVSLEPSQRILADCIRGELSLGQKLTRNKEQFRKAEQYQAALRVVDGETRYVRASREVWDEFCELRAEPSLNNLWMPDPRERLPKSGADLMLAAFSRVTGLPIASDNDKDFLLIDKVAPLPGLYVPRFGKWADLRANREICQVRGMPSLKSWSIAFPTMVR